MPKKDVYTKEQRRQYNQQYYGKNKPYYRAKQKEKREREARAREMDALHKHLSKRRYFNKPISLLPPSLAPQLSTHRFEQWAQAQIDRKHLEVRP